MNRRLGSPRFFWGLAAAVVYLVAAITTWPVVPVRILYEGDAPPPPYHWVRPPANLAAGNELPPPGTGSIAMVASVSRPASVATGDAQGVVVLPEGAIEPRPGETRADIRITPVDPATIAQAPSGFRFDGNVYRVEGVYAASGRPIVLRRPATVILRYPIHATEMFRRDPQTWTPLKAEVVQATLQIFASTAQLGAFVAAAPP